MNCPIILRLKQQQQQQSLVQVSQSSFHSTSFQIKRNKVEIQHKEITHESVAMRTLAIVIFEKYVEASFVEGVSATGQNLNTLIFAVGPA